MVLYFRSKCVYIRGYPSEFIRYTRECMCQVMLLSTPVTIISVRDWTNIPLKFNSGTKQLILALPPPPPPTELEDPHPPLSVAYLATRYPK